MHGYIFTIEIKENEMAVKRRKRKNRARKKILLLVFELLLLAVILGSLWVFSKTLGAATQTDSIDDGEAGINKDIDEKSLAAQEGYTNIALFGIDNRETGQYGSGNADTIMIASIDNSTKEVRLVSIYSLNIILLLSFIHISVLRSVMRFICHYSSVGRAFGC